MENNNMCVVSNNPELGGASAVVYGLSTKANGGEGSREALPNGSVSNVSVMRRKRGRPKKYPDGMATQQPVKVISSSPGMGFPSPNVVSQQQMFKRGRGRPRGSRSSTGLGRAHFVAAPTVSPPPGFGGETYEYEIVLTPHILHVYPGEDIHGKILSFARRGSQAVNVLSCTGPVASISVCSPGTSNGIIYEGLFEILTLNGIFTCAGNEGSFHRRGSLTVSLARSNGDVFGGCVSGPIIAAGPIQLILGSFDQVKRPPQPHIRKYHVPNPPWKTPPPYVVPAPVAYRSEVDPEASQHATLFLEPEPVGINDPKGPDQAILRDPKCADQAYVSESYIVVPVVVNDPKETDKAVSVPKTDQASASSSALTPSPEPVQNQNQAAIEKQVEEVSPDATTASVPDQPSN